MINSTKSGCCWKSSNWWPYSQQHLHANPTAPLHFSKESLWAIRECACQRVLCHISAICFKPTPPTPKKKNRQNKTYKLRVVLKGASKPILLDDTHNEPKMSFLSFFSSATHTTAAAAAAAVQCWGLSSLNRNVFSQLSIQKYFLFSVVSAMRSASRRRISFSFFHRSLNAKNLRGGNITVRRKKPFFLRDGWWWSSSGRRVLLYRPLCRLYYLRVIWGSCVTPASPRVFMITSSSFHMCALISYRLMCVCAKEVNELLKGHISSSIDLPPLFFIPPYLDPVCIFSPRGRLLLVPNKLEKCNMALSPPWWKPWKKKKHKFNDRQ